MPSCQITGVVSGGFPLVGSNIYSGTTYPVGGIQLQYANSGIGPIYIGLPPLSGSAVTIPSGGALSSGGLADGMELFPGGTYFVPKLRLTSGIETIRVAAPAAASGTKLFWEVF